MGPIRRRMASAIGFDVVWRELDRGSVDDAVKRLDFEQARGRPAAMASIDRQSKSLELEG